MAHGKIFNLQEGQLITGRKKLSEGTGIPESTIEDILKLLENEQQIQQQKTTKYRLITIVNWKEYQESDNKATTKQQQADTYKNDKKEKNSGREGVIEEVSENPPDPKNTPDMLRAYEIFSHNPEKKVWKGRVHQREATKVLLAEYGLDGIALRYRVSQKYRGEPDCPQIDSPADMLGKIVKMEHFLKTHST